ncbi:MAG: proton-conducting membrane transporter, partial [Firmicutes bacterium]|nr:proton-conducting membrane transporter [Bacillota bacterium]
MMLPSWYLLVPVLLPVIGGLVVGLCDPVGKKDRPRTWWTGAVLVLSVLSVIPVLLAPSMELQLFRLSDNLPVFLRTDDTGKFFAAVMAFVWCAAGFYSFGYLKGEEHLPRYYAFCLMTMGVLMGLCFSGNIITYY